MQRNHIHNLILYILFLVIVWFNKLNKSLKKSMSYALNLCRILKMYMQKGGNAANTAGVLAILGQNVDFFGYLPKEEEECALFEKQNLQ